MKAINLKTKQKSTSVTVVPDIKNSALFIVGNVDHSKVTYKGKPFKQGMKK